MEKIVGSAVELSTKSVFVVQVSIKKHGLKTLYLLFKVQESFFEVFFPSDQASPVAYSIVVLHYTHHIKSMVGQRGEGCQKAQNNLCLHSVG